METAVAMGILGSLTTVLTLLGVGLYRVLSDNRTRLQTVEHEIVGNGVSDGLVGKIDTMQTKRKEEHHEVQEMLERQREVQEDIVQSIQRSDAIQIEFDNVGGQNQSHSRNGENN